MDDNNDSAPAHGTNDLALVATPGPESVNGVKVYPPSYMPAKTVLHMPKKALVTMETIHIEGIHIAVFLLITFFLFIGMWKRSKS
jgi:hypothetical protein